MREEGDRNRKNQSKTRSIDRLQIPFSDITSQIGPKRVSLATKAGIVMATFVYKQNK